MNYEEVESLVGILRDNPALTELEVRSGTRALRLRRAPSRNSTAPQAHPSLTAAVPSNGVGALSLSASSSESNGTGGQKTYAAVDTSSPSAELALSTGEVTRVTALLVGVFRAHRKADVSVGSVVEAEQSLGQIEAMRLLNDCPSPIAGRITAILVQDGEPVEFGQPLFDLAAVEPAS